MMSVESYLEHAKKQREFVDEHRYSPYHWGNSTCDEILKNMDLALLNLCKAVLMLHNIDFAGRSDEDIVKYVSTNPHYYNYIEIVLGCQNLWKHAAKRRDRNSRNYNLARTTRALETFENDVREFYKPSNGSRIIRKFGR